MKDPLSKIRTLLQKDHIDGVLLSSVAHITYLTNYEGFSQTEREAYMLVTKKFLYLFTDGRYIEAVKTLRGITVKEITATFPLTKHLKGIATKEKLQTVGFEVNNLTVSEFTKIKKEVKLKPLTLHNIRVKKTDEEIATIKKACSIGDKAFSYLTSVIKPGMTEIEVANKLEWFIREQKATLSFPSIVAFGQHSAIPHHHTSKQKLKKRDIILLDFGVTYDKYCSDMTRTVFIGKPTTEQKKVYNIVLESQKKAAAYLNYAEKKAADADKVAREYILSHNYPSFSHALGHGVGIEVHEAPTLSPKSKDVLKDGMVFSIEPGIYLAGKFGIRIEDLFTLREGKTAQLTTSPHTLIQI